MHGILQSGARKPRHHQESAVAVRPPRATGVYGLSMAEVAVRRTVEETLRLALDLCLGVGAFRVAATGVIDVVVSDALPSVDGARRIELLARSCLAHPAARGRELYWNAEVSTEADAADDSLACVVVPLSRQGDEPPALLGVVDTWLPEPDEAQRAGLVALAAALPLDRAGPNAEPGHRGGRPERDELWWTDGATAAPEGPARAAAAGRVDAPDPVGAPHPVEVGAPAAPAAGGTESADGPSAGTTMQPGDAGATCEGVARSGGGPGDLLDEVLQHLPDALLATRSDGTIVLVNDRFARMVGRTPASLVGADARSLLAAAPARPGSPAPAADGDDQVTTRRLLVTGPDGGRMPVTATDVRLARGDHFVTVLRPAPSAEGGTGTTPIDCLDLVANLDDGVICLDATGTVVLTNHEADRLHGVPAGRTLAGAPLPELTGLRTEDGQPLTADEHPGALTLRDGARRTVQVVLGPDGDQQQHVTVASRPFLVDGGRGALVVLHDSTIEWVEHQRLTHYALYDPLTGLANRYLLAEELRRMLLWLGRQGGTVALVYLDLDGFKRINDDYGHEMGDEILAAVARRLRGAVRSDDVVARLGGDEFVIAHASAELLPDGDLVVSRLRKVLSAPFRVRNQVFDVGASIGWVSTDRGEEGPDALLAKADRAMYLQKRSRAVSRGPV